jgi:hypothetical protein
MEVLIKDFADQFHTGTRPKYGNTSTRLSYFGFERIPNPNKLSMKFNSPSYYFMGIVPLNSPVRLEFINGSISQARDASNILTCTVKKGEMVIFECSKMLYRIGTTESLVRSSTPADMFIFIGSKFFRSQFKRLMQKKAEQYDKYDSSQLNY